MIECPSNSSGTIGTRARAGLIRVAVHYARLRQLAIRCRILFCFDPERQAVLLVAGDKQGKWSGWYKAAISLAEER